MIITDKDSRLKNTQVLRRYLDLAKFIDLLRTQKLYLRRADLLDDRYEGSFTPKVGEAIREAFDASESEMTYEVFKNNFRRSSYINCWTASLHDNMALWQIYGKSNNSVAITTTVGRLESELLKNNADGYTYLYKVEYINHWHYDKMDILIFPKVFKYKLKAYKYENEVRVIHYKEENLAIQESADIESGLYFNVELNQLLRSIVVSPDSEPWFIDIVKDLTRQYGITAPVKSSMMSKKPS